MFSLIRSLERCRTRCLVRSWISVFFFWDVSEFMRLCWVYAVKLVSSVFAQADLACCVLFSGFVCLACGSLSNGKFWPSSLLALNSLDFGSEISEWIFIIHSRYIVSFLFKFKLNRNKILFVTADSFEHRWMLPVRYNFWRTVMLTRCFWQHRVIVIVRQHIITQNSGFLVFFFSLNLISKKRN